MTMATIATWTQNSRLIEARDIPQVAVAQQGVRRSFEHNFGANFWHAHTQDPNVGKTHTKKHVSGCFKQRELPNMHGQPELPCKQTHFKQDVFFYYYAPISPSLSGHPALPQQKKETTIYMRLQNAQQQHIPLW